DMRIAFATFDHDGDGLISTSETQFTMASIGFKPKPEDVAQIFKAVDKNGDGFLSFEEFKEAMLNYEELTEKKFMKEAFKIFDKDKDGFLSEKDLRFTMWHLGLELSHEDAQAMLKALGIKPGEKISFDGWPICSTDGDEFICFVCCIACACVCAYARVHG
ncbi:hypothetical protein HELRODRAFT_65716, partial [Helobdella robusta]|uniref:EF-hand domain-containing protein n=1 Tax=Helobdella robusta TaxID=6412 RepID=T1FYB8_HELRO